jgi:hypothetical protein
MKQREEAVKKSKNSSDNNEPISGGCPCGFAQEAARDDDFQNMVQRPAHLVVLTGWLINK